VTQNPRSDEDGLMLSHEGATGRRRYRIVVRGEFEELLSTAFAGVSAVPHRGTTILTADVVDLSEFYGVIDRLRDFAIDVVSVEEL
jgi:hypothetical protein